MLCSSVVSHCMDVDYVAGVSDICATCIFSTEVCWFVSFGVLILFLDSFTPCRCETAQQAYNLQQTKKSLYPTCNMQMKVMQLLKQLEKCKNHS
jgi:hypothetical protein